MKLTAGQKKVAKRIHKEFLESVEVYGFEKAKELLQYHLSDGGHVFREVFKKPSLKMSF